STARVVSILRAAGLVAASSGRPGFAVRQVRSMGRPRRLLEIGVTSNNLTAEAWSVAMRALGDAGLLFSYRCDRGLGARVFEVA
ncbi:hypothetical protein, partial [Staphylococcus aureus]